MTTSLVLLLFSILPVSSVVEDHFDRVELNHFYDENGKWIFDQVIWSNWDNVHHRHKIEAWRLVKENREIHPENIAARAAWEKEQKKKPELQQRPFNAKSFGHPINPVYDWKHKTYYSLFDDQGTLRRVRANYSVESWTQYDEELVDREFYDKNKRKDLRVIK